MKYTIYTDGAYSQKNNEGAFAYVILNVEDVEVERKARVIKNETNNRAELKAIISAVHRLPSDATSVTVYSDSQYALKTLSGEWSHSNNHDIFKVWYKVLKEHPDLDISYEWVKGHNGNVYNELCDQLCNDALGYDANKEFEKYKKYKRKEKEEPKIRITSDLAWRIYNFIECYKAGNYGEMTLQEALDADFDY